MKGSIVALCAIVACLGNIVTPLAGRERLATASEPDDGSLWIDGLAEAKQRALEQSKPILVALLAQPLSGQRPDIAVVEFEAVLLRDAEVVKAETAYVCARPRPEERAQAHPGWPKWVSRNSGASYGLAVLSGAGQKLVFRFGNGLGDRADVKAAILASLVVGTRVHRLVSLAPAADADERQRLRTSVLAQSLTDSDPEIRRAAAASLGYDPGAEMLAFPALERAAQEENAVVRRTALAAMFRFNADGQDSLVAASALRALDDRDDDVFKEAALYVPRLAELLATALQALVRGMKDPQRRGASTSALTALGPRAAGATPGLVALLNAAKTPAEMSPALQILEAIGPGASAAVPTLSRIIREMKPTTDSLGDPWYDDSAPWGVLLSLGPAAKAAVPDLIALLNDKKRNRSASIEVLGAIGGEARAAVGALRALAASEPSLAAKAKEAIRRIEADAAPAPK